MPLPPPGDYAITIVGQAPWHRHRMTVHAVDDAQVHGVLALDRSAGPGVAPRSVDELPTSTPFVAARGERASFAFDIVVGAAFQRTWRFVLWPVGDEMLTGIVEIEGRRTGVLARRT